MIRYFTPLAVLFVASTAHAQTFTRTYTATDGRGNSTTTTIEAPATPEGLSAVGMIANQTVYGGFPSYANGVPSYGANCPPTYNYYPPTYNYGYAGYPNYGYAAPYPYPAPPPAYPYGYPPQTYYVPGQTTYLPHPSFGWNAPPSITTPPQVVTTPGYPYGGYAPYNYGWNTQTTVANAGITYQRNGVTLSVGGTSVRRR